MNALFFALIFAFLKIEKSKRKCVFLSSFFVEHISGEKTNVFCEREKEKPLKRAFS